MKAKAISLTITIVLLFAMSITLIACGNNPSITPHDALVEWQNYIEDDTPITKMAIPGSHDSGTKGMIAQAETQGATILDQLKMGARYFDIRVNGSDKDGMIFHSFINGSPFKPIADDLKQFLIDHPTEFLILDFQHFKNKGEQVVFDILTANGLFDYAIKNDSDMSDIDYINSLTLKDVRGKVLIFYGNDMADKYNYIFRRNNDDCTVDGSALDSLYMSDLNKKGSIDFINGTIPEYLAHINEKKSGILVLQGQLTAPNFFVSLRALESGHNDNMNNYTYSLKNDKTALDNVNVIMRDYIDTDAKKVLSILTLNYYKGNVKPILEDNYKSLCDIK